MLGGKEGPTGLMPPLGAALTDDQVAAALTYIRREWGHTASAVDPSTVKEVRAPVERPDAPLDGRGTRAAAREAMIQRSACLTAASASGPMIA